MMKRRVKTAFVVVASCIAFAVIALVIWNNGLRDRFYPHRWGVVDEGGLYRSGAIHPAIEEEVLIRHGVNAIINLAWDKKKYKDEDFIARKMGIDVFRYDLKKGGFFTASEYADVIGLMVELERQNKIILIHCDAGINRTGAIVAVYRILVEKWKAQEAYDELVSFGWRRNSSLLAHLNENMQEIADLLRRRNAIDIVPEPPPKFNAE
jgi:protein tyrosine/serine phosphatase